MLTYVAAFSAALFASLVATPMARALAIRLGALDRPDERKLHTEPVPYLGGLAIIVAFVAAVGAGAALKGVGEAAPQVAAALAGALVMAGMGLWDDLRVVPGWIKVPLEIAAAALLFFVGTRAQLFGVPAIDFVVTVAWVVGITNAVNYMDNVDGLTAGTSAIAALFFAGLAIKSGQFVVASLGAAIAGCSLGFLWHNRAPARIFMGDAGSLFLGFLLAVLGLELKFDNIVRVTFFVPVAVLAVPILDALLVSVSRMRRGLSPIKPGRDHISHRLMRLGIRPTAVVILIYFVAAACGWLGVVIALARPITAYMLMGWLIVVGLFVGALLLKVDNKT